MTDSYDLLREYALLPVSTWAGGYVRPGKDARMQLIALLASVERLQSIEQMLREPGEDVIRDAAIAVEKAALTMDRNTSNLAHINTRNMTETMVVATIAVLRKKARV